MVQFTSWTWRRWALFMQRSLELLQGKHSTVVCVKVQPLFPIGSMYGIYTNIGGILMVNVTIYGIHGSYGFVPSSCSLSFRRCFKILF